MSRSLPISDQDVADVVRLVGDAAGMDAPVHDRRLRIMDGLVRLTAADTWMWVASRGITDPHGAVFYAIDGGWASDAERTAVWHANSQTDLAVAAMTGVDPATHQTFAFDPDHAGWGDGAIWRRHLEPTGVHHVLLSIYPVGDDCISGIGVHRRADRTPFAPPEVALAHLVVGQLDWLHRAGTDVPANNDQLRLTARQREVLVHLLGGDGRKKLAAKLGLSLHTVNDHVKAIYRAVGVTSNAELLAKFMPGGGV